MRVALLSAERVKRAFAAVPVPSRPSQSECNLRGEPLSDAAAQDKAEKLSWLIHLCRRYSSTTALCHFS